MLKLSKISKMILISGLVLTFACGSVTSNAWAASADKCETSCNKKKGTAKSACLAQCAAKACEADCDKNYKNDKVGRNKCKLGCANKRANTTIGETSSSGKISTGLTYDEMGGLSVGADGNVQSNNRTIRSQSTGTDTDLTKGGLWQQASAAKQNAQNDYTNASKAYNVCVAQKGTAACSGALKAMNEAKGKLDSANKEYNQAQKDASKAYNSQQKAQAKAEKAADKDLNKKQKEYDKCLKKNLDDPSKCNDKAEALEAAKKTAASVRGEDTSSGTNKLDKLANAVTGASDDPRAVSDAMNNLRAYKEQKEQAAAAAEKECDKYSAMTSKDAQVKAQKACKEAVELRKEADAASKKYEELKNSTGDSGVVGGVNAASRRLNTNVGKGEKGVVDISQSRKISISKGSGDANTLSGYKSQFFQYGSTGDALGTVTRRAALAIVGLKPIVYIFAGFGLIAFAWMAIFNKISWKWFGNIAMGLFLVANMGRLIEYFVVGGEGHYYVGAWGANASKKGGANTLANAFKDSYYVYGDVNFHEKGIRNFTEWGVTVNGGKANIFSSSAAGFCQGTSASGWANFTSCMGDVLATAKKATDTVLAVKATVEDVGARIQAVGDAGKNIAQAAKAIAQGGSVTDVLSNVGNMLNNVNNMVSTTTGVVGSVTNGMSTISNNIQDMGKSQAQQKELADRRASGEATNKFDAMLKGQEWDANTGGVEKVDGKYASKDTWVSQANNFANTVKNGAASVNSLSQGMITQAATITHTVENTSLNDLIGFGSTATINSNRRDRQERKAQEAAAAAQAKKQEEYLNSNAGKNATYRDLSSKSSNMYDSINYQKNEINNLENEKKSAENAVKQNCQGDNDTSTLCQASKKMLEATEASLNSKKDQLAQTEKDYEAIKKETEKAYNDAMASNVAKANDDYEKASKTADAVCSANPSSSECAKARRAVLDASKQIASYASSQENKNDKTNRYETKEDVSNKLASNAEEQAMKRAEEQLKYEQEQESIRLKTEANQANQAYNKAMDDANNLYDQMNKQQKEAEELEAQAKQKAREAANACANNKESPTCTTAQTAATAAKEAADNKASQAKQSAKQYEAAKQTADNAYKNAVQANINQAQRDYDNAKAQAETAKQQMDDAKAKLPDAATAAKEAQTAYNTAQSEASKAKEAYEKAAKGDDQAEIARLKEEYEAKLKAMAEAQKEAQSKENAYQQMKKQKQEAEQAYNQAYAKANDAGSRLASYTDESVNRTNASRMDSNEDLDNKALINQYQSETNPNAVAQASKNNYIESKNKADIARNTYNEKQAVAAQAKRDYEAAVARAEQSGKDEDRRIAERLKSNYDLAVNEVTAAEKEYNRLNSELGGYEKDYLRKAISSEQYNQKIYTQQMTNASADINKYELAVANQKRTVDAAASKYTQAKNSLQPGDNAGLARVAQLYDEYKAAKEEYETYQGYLNKAKSDYSTAQRNYQTSVSEVARMQNALKEH